MLEADRLCAGYGRARVLFDVSLELRCGEVVALLGRNGAGKSTTLKAIMGIVPATAGTVRFDARRVDGLEPFERARCGLGYVPEDRRIFAELTVAENLEVGRRGPRGDLPAWTEARVLALFPALAALRSRMAAQMSGGEQQMLAIARTLMGNPTVLLLDEPSEGLAPLIVAQIVQAIVALKASGLAVLLCEQNLRFAEKVADRAYFLAQGRIRAEGAVAQMRDNLLA